MDPIPDDVRGFLERNIDNIDQLEILRLIGEDPTRTWAAAELAREVQTDAGTAAAHAAALHARGLVQADGRPPDVRCRHGAHAPDLERLLARLLEVYMQRPVTMIRLVYARPADPVRALADAFRWRKEGG